MSLREEARINNLVEVSSHPLEVQHNYVTLIANDSKIAILFADMKFFAGWVGRELRLKC